MCEISYYPLFKEMFNLAKVFLQLSPFVRFFYAEFSDSAWSAPFSSLDSRLLILDSQFSILDSGFSILGSTFSVLSSQFSMLDSRCSGLVSRLSVLDSQLSILDSRLSEFSDRSVLDIGLQMDEIKRLDISYTHVYSGRCCFPGMEAAATCRHFCHWYHPQIHVTH